MKVTILLLSAVVCFAVVNAAILDEPEPMNLDLLDDEDFTDQTNENEAWGIFGTFFWGLKAALRTLKGVNCIIKQVIVIKEAAEKFPINIQLCGADAVKSFSDVFTGVQSIKTTCDDVIYIYENYCKNDVSVDGKPITPKSCARKMFKPVYKLNKLIKTTKKAIKKIPKVPGESAACSSNAVNEFTNPIASFASTVKDCSKLTS